MTDIASLLVPDRGQRARAIHLVDKASFECWAASRTQAERALLEAQGFDGKTGYARAILPAGDGDWQVVSAVADVSSLSPWCLAKLGGSLPAGTYRLTSGEPGKAALGWLLAQHRFERYRSKPRHSSGPAVLLSGEAAKIEPTVRLAEATVLVRELVDTPASDFGPAELEAAVRAEALKLGASVTVTTGDALDQGFSLIAAVGRAAARDRAPRLIELQWGDESHPLVALIGKGVCFDTGGLDLKPARGMRWMKKDMGGAAHALALARLVIAARLPVRVHLLIPAVENAVGPDAVRPGDVLPSRAGKTIEIDNTDAEGRLVLADAIARAGEAGPTLILDFATLTGAARTALGPDLPALFANDEELATGLLAAGEEVGDPLWRLPLWDGYDEMLKSDIADLTNSSDSPMAGAITAALFLRRFVPEATPWAHVDTFAWRTTARPGRPKGGDALGLRAAFALIEQRFPWK